MISIFSGFVILHYTYGDATYVYKHCIDIFFFTDLHSILVIWNNFSSIDQLFLLWEYGNV